MILDLMIDLETMDSKPTSAITAIGAVYFELETAKVHSSFYTNVNLQSCIDGGLTVNGGTVYWWLKQDKAAQEHMLLNPVPLVVACTAFSNFLQIPFMSSDFTDEEIYLWGNGAAFDNVIIRNAFRAINMKFPISFRQDCDVRTVARRLMKLSKFKGNVPPRIENTGVAHNALDDCLHQIKYLHNSLMHLIT